jgi:hypothetical protein
LEQAAALAAAVLAVLDRLLAVQDFLLLDLDQVAS